MRDSLVCPKCDGRLFWVIDPVAQPDHRYSDVIQKTRVATTKDHLGVRAEVGSFTTYICDECGYTEWYAQDLNELRLLAEDPEVEGIDLVTAEDEPPYR